MYQQSSIRFLLRSHFGFLFFSEHRLDVHTIHTCQIRTAVGFAQIANYKETAGTHSAVFAVNRSRNGRTCSAPGRTPKRRKYSGRRFHTKDLFLQIWKNTNIYSQNIASCNSSREAIPRLCATRAQQGHFRAYQASRWAPNHNSKASMSSQKRWAKNSV